MSNGTPEETAKLYMVLDIQDVNEFNEAASKAIVEGFAPLGSLATHQVGANVHYLQAFWRPEAVSNFKA
jgi:hypothetical protein